MILQIIKRHEATFPDNGSGYDLDYDTGFIGAYAVTQFYTLNMCGLLYFNKSIKLLKKKRKSFRKIRQKCPKWIIKEAMVTGLTSLFL